MPNPKRVVDGDTNFRRGMNSVNPLDLPEGFYLRAFNTINRGGVLQTRPGYRWVATLPAGRIQGFTLFTPKGAVPQLVAVIGGLVYRSLHPYTTFEQVPGIDLYSEAPQVYFAHTIKAVQRTTSIDVDGNEVSTLAFIVPRNVLMISDNTSAPAFYDGISSGHITGPKTTPVSGPMAWSGDRLWVSVGNLIYVSDISDPFSFYEDTYNTLGGRQSFTVSGDVTAMAETPSLDDPQLLVFTDSKTTAFQSSIRDRTLWASTVDFQLTLFPTLGCVSQRSLVAQHGLLYWMSAYGLVSLDAALQSKVSSEIDYQDNEMAFSKSRVNGDLSGVAGASFENFLLMSVPYADNFNAHTWVLDHTVRDSLNERQPKAWSSIWTGTRPVEWAYGSVHGVPRLFCASCDADGSTRVWEAFDAKNRDNDCDIEWLLETRAYTNQNIGAKEFRYAELTLGGLQGDVDIQVAWAGVTKGRWRTVANSRIRANEGTIDATKNLGGQIFALKKQVRTYRTQDARDLSAEDFTTCGVESSFSDHRDVGFQLTIRGSGACAVNSVRVFMDEIIENTDGDCAADETDDNFVRVDGAATHDLTELSSALPISYTAEATATSAYGGISVSASASAISSISQAAADKMALQRARAIANAKLAFTAPPFIGGSFTVVDSLAQRLDFTQEDNSMYLPLL